MRTSILTLAVAVTLGMLVAGAQSWSGQPVVRPAEAAVNGGFGLNPECPGGGSPACVVCSGIQCTAACNGDYTCDIVRNREGTVEQCSYDDNNCETATPMFRGWLLW